TAINFSFSNINTKIKHNLYLLYLFNYSYSITTVFSCEYSIKVLSYRPELCKWLGQIAGFISFTD
ncbi:hypothetical protein, partial [Acinetobacter sp. ANC 4169]|uniref:hypothetical protein n=1 Tax=Acinetobacter sp. ANC 4169 TaxID=1977879 RepID=UPI00196ACBFF